MFTSCTNEHDYTMKSSWIEGEIPKDIQGTYFRNGPGHQPVSGKGSQSPLDGDGMVISLALSNGKAYFKSRYVRTQGFVAEQRAGRKLFRTPFSQGAASEGWLYNPLDLQFKNVANTNVVHWNGRLYALWEAGKPYELDPRSLETIGESNLDGLLSPSSPDPIAGHYRILHDKEGGKRLVLFGTNVTLRGMEVKFLELDEEGRCVNRVDHCIGGMDTTFIHDMLVTASYYILLMGPTKFNWVRFATEYLVGRCSIAQCISYDKAGRAKAILIPREPSVGQGEWQGSRGRPLEIEADGGFFPFHHVNAYEEGDEVVIDTLGWESIDFDTVMDAANAAEGKSPPRHYLRWRLDQAAGRHLSIEKMATDEQGHRNCEFPIIDQPLTGLKHEEVICACDTPHGVSGTTQALIKLAFTTTGQGKGLQTVGYYDPGPRRFCGEPCLIPKSEKSYPSSSPEGQGQRQRSFWVIASIHDAVTLKADICILDGDNLSAGPVATLHLPHALPMSLHGCFSDEFLGPGDEDASSSESFFRSARVIAV